MGFDIEAYFRRIGYTGRRGATIETLEAIVYAHATTIAFENLDPFLGTPNRLDLESLQRKLVDSKRGGYCYEQNLTLRAVLIELGYSVTGYAARVLWGQPIETITPRSHMVLRVDLDDGPRIVDVGFGGMTLTGVMRLERDVEQKTPHEVFRFVDLDGDFAQQSLVAGKWQTTYRFDLVRQYPIDYEASNWYLSTSAASHFVTGLIAARPFDGGRFALRGRELATHHLDGPTERRTLRTASDVIGSLEHDFGLQLPDWAPLEHALARLG